MKLPRRSFAFLACTLMVLSAALAAPHGSKPVPKPKPAPKSSSTAARRNATRASNASRVSNFAANRPPAPRQQQSPIPERASVATPIRHTSTAGLRDRVKEWDGETRQAVDSIATSRPGVTIDQLRAYQLQRARPKPISTAEAISRARIPGSTPSRRLTWSGEFRNPRNYCIKDTFANGEYTTETLKDDLTAYRYYGGTIQGKPTQSESRFFSEKRYPTASSAWNELSLHSTLPTRVSTAVIPKNTKVLKGKVKAYQDRTGEGPQVVVLNGKARIMRDEPLPR
jgi:hypothetical protein